MLDSGLANQGDSEGSRVWQHPKLSLLFSNFRIKDIVCILIGSDVQKDRDRGWSAPSNYASFIEPYSCNFRFKREFSLFTTA